MTTPLATFSGLATGIDTAALIEGLTKLERAPIARLQARQDDLKLVSKKFEGLKAKLTSLKDAATALSTRSNVLSSKASSSATNAVAAAAVGAASAGSYEVEVTSLATAERTYSNGVASRSQAGPFGAGSITIQVGSGPAATIDLDGTESLDGIAAEINAQNLKARASVVYDGSSYRLLVSGNDTGAANGITFTESGVNLGLTDPANEYASAADAVFSVDGLAMTRSSNTVTDAISGVTLTLSDEGRSVVTVGRDDDAFATKVQAFVDAYNAIAKGINSEFAYTGAANGGAALSGDATLRGLQGRLSSTFLEFVGGAPASLNRLSAVGIKTTRSGTLEIDKAALDKALDTDPEGVVALFAGNDDTDTPGAMEAFVEMVDLYTKAGDGFLSGKISRIGDQVSAIDDQIASMELRVSKYEDTLRAQFTAMERIVSGLQGQGQQLLGILNSMTR